MKKFIFGALLIVSCVFTSVKQPVFAESSQTSTTTEVLTFTDNQNQHNVGSILGFAVNGNSIYYINETLNKFDTTTKLNYTLPYENVTEIQQTQNFVVFTSNSNLIILKNGNQINVPGFNVSCNFFNVFEKDNCLHIAYVEGSKLHYVKINSELIIDIQRESSLGSQELVATCLNDTYIYLIAKNGTNYGLLKVDTLTLTQTQLSFNFSCSHIEMFEQDGETYFLLTTRLNQALTVAHEATDFVENITTKLTDVTAHESFSLGEVDKFSDVKYYNGLIYVADETNKSIQTFKLVNSELKPNSIIIASNCYENTYFNNVNDFQIANRNNLLVSDTGNNRIQKLGEETKILSTYNQTKLDEPKFYLTSNNQDFWFYFDGKLIKQSETTNLEFNVGQSISDVKLDSKNNVYYLDYNLNKLIKIANNKNTLDGVLDNLSLTETSKLEILNNGYVILTGNTFNVYNTSFSLVSSLTLSTTIIDFTSDYYGNLYALTPDGIIKLSNENNVLSQGATLSYNTTNLTLIRLDKVSGSFVAYDNSNSKFIKITNLSFVNGLSNFEHSINATEITPLETILKSGNVLADTYISEYPFNTGLKQELIKGTKVFVLDEDENSYYIMYNNNNTLEYGYILKNALEVKTFSINQANKVTVINKNIKLYTLPTILRDNNFSFAYTTCQLNSELNVVNFNLVSIDNSEYFAVLTNDNKILYVNSSDVTLSDTTEISALPDLNAELIVADNTKINLYASNTSTSEIILELDASQKVYVENFDTTKEYTYITVIKADKTQVSGYVLTKNLKLLDNNPNLTSAYVLLAVAFVIGIASIIVYVKYKRSND